MLGRRPPTDELLQAHDERGAAVEPARFLAGVVVHRALFTKGDGLQPVGADAAAGHVVAHRVGAPFPERLIVFRGADVAGMPLKRETQRIVFVHCRDGLVENPHGSRPQRVTVEVEMDVLE